MIKSIKTSSVRSRRKFDETFKREAVQNWLNSGKSAGVVGEELGLTANLLYAWRKLVPAVAGGRATAPSRAQWPIYKANWMLPIVNSVMCGNNALF